MPANEHQEIYLFKTFSPAEGKVSRMQADSIIRTAIFTVFIILLLGSVLGCSFQTRLIFPAQRLPADYQFTDLGDGEEVFIPTEDGEMLSAIHFKGRGERVLLYFHGNAGSLESWKAIGNDLSFLKADILIIDYRGYGKSTGKISEKGLNLDAAAAWDYLVKQGVSEENIIIYGRSLGTGVAVQLAGGKKSGGLILESPFHNLRGLIYREFWFMMPFFYLRYTFNSCEAIKKVESRILMVHGRQDETIQYHYGEQLFACAAGEKEMIGVENGDHNNLIRFPEFRESVLRFVERS